MLTALFISITILLINELKAQINVPIKLGNCKVKLNNTSIVDLSSLDDVKNPRLFKIVSKIYSSKLKKILFNLINLRKDTGNGFTYWFNPCKNFKLTYKN